MTCSRPEPSRSMTASSQSAAPGPPGTGAAPVGNMRTICALETTEPHWASGELMSAHAGSRAAATATAVPVDRRIDGCGDKARPHVKGRNHLARPLTSTQQRRAYLPRVGRHASLCGDNGSRGDLRPIAATLNKSLKSQLLARLATAWPNGFCFYG